MNPSNNYLQKLSNSSELERTLLSGITGQPELRKDELHKYLGVFREQVMAILLKQQVKEPAIYTELLAVLKDNRASVMILNGMIDNIFTEKYKKLAKKNNIGIKVVFNPNYDQNTGLVVASTSAVNFPKVEYEPRKNKLRKLGLSEPLIQSAGKKLCRKCFEKIKANAPAETINYDQISVIDRLTGDKCPAHSSE